MGCTHSRSEDLRQRSSLLASQAFMNSLEDVPGYFNQTLTAIDYLSSELPSAHSNKPEMSYNGPPSHLQNSEDVHPFWFEYGRDYHPKERFMDRSLEVLPGSTPIPPSLIPGTQTAQEMRNIEIRETMASLRQQVQDVWTTRIDEEEDGDETSSRLPSSLPSSPMSSSEVDGNMTQEERSTLEFFESMINESQDFDINVDDSYDTSRNISPVPQDVSLGLDDTLKEFNLQAATLEEESQTWNTHGPKLTSLLPNNLSRPAAGHVYSVVSEGQRSPLEGSPHRKISSNTNSIKTNSQPNGHAGFLQKNMYLPKENSITSLHRNSTASLHRNSTASATTSPSRKAPPPPTKPKPSRGGSGNKRYSYPMSASEPTEFGANFLVANKSTQGNQVSSSGNQQNGRLHHSNGVTSNEQNAGVKNIAARFNVQQPRHSNSFNEQTRGPPPPVMEKRTRPADKGFRHSMYVDNNNIPAQYSDYYNGYNGNVNNSNEQSPTRTAGKPSGVYNKQKSSDSVLSPGDGIPMGDIQTGAKNKNRAVVKDTETGEDMVLHGIQADLLHLQLK